MYKPRKRDWDRRWELPVLGIGPDREALTEEAVRGLCRYKAEQLPDGCVHRRIGDEGEAVCCNDAGSWCLMKGYVESFIGGDNDGNS